MGKVPWFAYKDSAGAWTEGYYDDAQSLAFKYDMVNAKGLAGTGMWTLLMDQGDNALWSLIANKFVNDTTPPSGGIRLLPRQQRGDAERCLGSNRCRLGGPVLLRSKSATPPAVSGSTGTSARPERAGRTSAFPVTRTNFAWQPGTSGNTQPWMATVPPPGANLALGVLRVSPSIA